ncbi:MAG: GDSL-type esterase/lipase family protein [Peptococcaceae bacterium]
MKKEILITLGDSITAGWPYEQEFSWVNSLQENLINKCIMNKGVSGDTFGDMLLRFEKDVLSYEPEYCFVMGGANEAYQHIPQTVLRENFLKLIAELRKISCNIIVGIPSPVEDDLMEKYLQDIRKWLTGYCHTNNIPTLDFYTLMLDADNRIDHTFFVDGCHPNKKGYELMGEYALRKLAELKIT